MKNVNELDFRFTAIKSAIFAYAKIKGLLGGTESEITQMKKYANIAEGRLLAESGRVAAYIFKDLNEYEELVTNNSSLNEWVFQYIDFVGQCIDEYAFDDMIRMHMGGRITQTLVLKDDSEYVLRNSSGKVVDSIPLKSGLTLVSGNWQSGKSTFANSFNVKWKANKQLNIFSCFDKEEAIRDSKNNKIRPVKTRKAIHVNDDINYLDFMEDKFDLEYISEPDEQSLNFNLFKVCRRCERDPHPVIIDSVSKAEYYIKTLGLEKGVSSAMMVVADNLNFYSHRKPIIMIGWTEIPIDRLVGGISNVIIIDKKKGSEIRKISYYKRGLLENPDEYTFAKK